MFGVHHVIVTQRGEIDRGGEREHVDHGAP
jgi:hypothetical protein